MSQTWSSGRIALTYQSASESKPAPDLVEQPTPDTSAKPVPDIAATNINHAAPVISLRGVDKVFGVADAATEALKQINLTIEPGEFVAIMGPSGCGKTTLMNLIGLLDRPSSGEYFLNGRNVRKFGAARAARLRGREIGFIFQNFNLLPDLTALDNVVLPLTYQRGLHYRKLERASELLATLGLQNRELFFPRQLSGGQIQRVAIARALINHPSIILADEPTGNLDTANSLAVMEELAKIHRAGNTILMVTHNPDLLRFASRVIQMKDGQIAQDVELTGTDAHAVSSRFQSHRARVNRRKPQLRRRGGRRKS